MHEFLRKTRYHDYKIFIINQTDKLRFNRALLINIGAVISGMQGFDYFAMHDVDLLPDNRLIPYSFPENFANYSVVDGNKSVVLHLTPSGIHPRYDYPTFIGGVLIVPQTVFQKVNGMSNRYWGWGMEDDEFYVRLSDANIKIRNILEPTFNITTGKNTFKHIHDKVKRPRDLHMTKRQREIAHQRDRKTGLKTIHGMYHIEKMTEKYILSSSNRHYKTSYPYTAVNVKLICDYLETPWCNASLPLYH